MLRLKSISVKLLHIYIHNVVAYVHLIINLSFNIFIFISIILSCFLVSFQILTCILVDPVTVSIDLPPNDPVERTVGTSVTLNCTWDSTAYYFGWYKDGSLVYAMDLAFGEVLTDTQSATSSYEGRYSELTIPGSSLADSGSYTCVVSCEARDVALDDIPEALRDSKDVLFYGKNYNI